VPEPSLLERSLALSGQVVIECDETLAVLAEHGRTRGLTRDGRLVPELEDAVQARLSGARHAPSGVPGLPEVCLLEVDRTPSGRCVVWLRHDSPSRAAFSRRLRERYGFKLRSQQLLALLAQGLKNREIAEQLGLREATVKTYLHGVYETLGVNSRTQAIAELRRTVQLDQS
jgi:DNA-binding NarL/FixJ family response regulator